MRCTGRAYALPCTDEGAHLSGKPARAPARVSVSGPARTSDQSDDRTHRATGNRRDHRCFGQAGQPSTGDENVERRCVADTSRNIASTFWQRAH